MNFSLIPTVEVTKLEFRAVHLSPGSKWKFGAGYRQQMDYEWDIGLYLNGVENEHH